MLIGCTDSALQDLRRELANLSVGIEREFLDARGCLAHVLANPPETRLFIIYANSTLQIQQLERLNESVIGQPILALVDPTNDPSIMVRAMRAGAAQVVRVPLQADDFRAAMNRIATQFGHPPIQSRTITVLGAIEGSGVTTIALNLASEIGRLRNSPCILAEGAVAFGRLANYLNIQPEVTIGDLLADMDHVDVERVHQALTKVDDHLQALTGSYRAIVPAELSAENVFKLLGYVKQLTDVVVMDGRYAYEDLDFEFMAQSQQVVLVGQPTVPSLYALKMLLESLAQRECLAQQFVVINRLGKSTGEFSTHRIEEVLQTSKVYSVANDFASVTAAENAGKTLRMAVPSSHALADVTKLARALLGMAEPPHAGWSFLDSLNRIAHSFHHST